tara:strand:- start:14852 stop:15424 length:573 start_codon:yes stop_codon:yes gene_type:complete
MINLIGITGKKRSGKNYFATACMNELVRLGHTTHQDAFANELKLEAANMLANFGPLTMSQYLTEFEGPNKSVYRPFLQWYGTEFKREQMGLQNYWLIALRDNLVSCVADFVFITDARFLNEAAFLRKRYPTTIVRVSRLDYMSKDPADYHLSETESIRIDADAEIEAKSTPELTVKAALFAGQLSEAAQA